MKKIGVYIHIPFCARKCAYCDFNSYDSGYDPSVINALENEILFYKDVLGKYTADTLFIGGGTPSFIPEKDIERLINVLCLSSDCEITLESNPGTLTLNKLLFYKKMGINRLSMGLQSFNERELLLLERIHTPDIFLKSYNLARQAGFNNINIDIMFGIPEQTPDSWNKTLDTVIALNPEHISAYSLILGENTRFNPDLIAACPDEESEREMYEILKKRLKGYEHYEISNFAKQGKQCRHNLKYWSMDEYIGFGPGAHSFYNSKRYANLTSLEAYKATVPPIKYSEAEDEKELKKDFLITGLRLIKGISYEKYFNMFKSDFESEYRAQIKKYVRLRLLEPTDKGIRFTDEGISLSNTVLTDFI